MLVKLNYSVSSHDSKPAKTWPTEAEEWPDQTPPTGSRPVQPPSEVCVLSFRFLIIYSAFGLHAGLLNS